MWHVSSGSECREKYSEQHLHPPLYRTLPSLLSIHSSMFIQLVCRPSMASFSFHCIVFPYVYSKINVVYIKVLSVSSCGFP